MMRYGLVVKLKDDCVISWDGTNIHHCTSMRIDPKCPSKRYGEVCKSDIYGSHFVNSAGNLKLTLTLMAFNGHKKWFCRVKSLKSVSWKAHLKMIQSFFLHNSVPIIPDMGLNDDKSWNRPQKDCNAINLWLFMATWSDSVQSNH